jgi:hypothetical protein
VAQISQNAFARLFALRRAELLAIERLKEGDGYSDFFVEGSGPPWHEAFGDAGGDEIERRVPASRMAFIDQLRLRAEDGDDYSDFFVEGSGPPWHEAFGDAVKVDPAQVASRARALRGLGVLQAYARAKSAD